jgi:hypothetical protein
MAHSSYARANFYLFLGVLALSALTMVWLFWHHPLKTLIATVMVLAALGISARLARSVDAENASDLTPGEHVT